jgi:hypothetical protein
MKPRRLSGYTPADLQNMGFFLDAVHFFDDDSENAPAPAAFTDPEPEVATLRPSGNPSALAPQAASLTVAPNLNEASSSVGRHVPVEPVIVAASLNDLPQVAPNLNDFTPAIKVRTFARVERLCRAAVRRSKVSKLPEDIRNNLNALLLCGKSYSHVIAWLNTQGHPGFNKVNLHNWRIGGFQDWLHNQPILAEPNLSAQPDRREPAGTFPRIEDHVD